MPRSSTITTPLTGGNFTKSGEGTLLLTAVSPLNGTLTAAGATVLKEPADVGGGLTIAVLSDADGNPIGLRQSAGE